MPSPTRRPPVQQLDAILADHPVDEAGRLSYGGSGSPTRLLCGGFELCPSLPDDLAGFLPPVLTLDAGTGLVRWLEPLFALLKEETQASSPEPQRSSPSSPTCS